MFTDKNNSRLAKQPVKTQSKPAAAKAAKPKAKAKPKASTKAVKHPRPEWVQPIIIEALSPEIDGGLYAAKAVAGDTVTVEADIYKDGHDVIKAQVLHRVLGSKAWKASSMMPTSNDRWQGSFVPKENARYEYTVTAWVDPIATWMRDTEKRALAGALANREVLEGLQILRRLEDHSKDRDRVKIAVWAKQLELSKGAGEEVLGIVRNPEFKSLSEQGLVQDLRVTLEPARKLIVDRAAARTGAWYELFVRSQGKVQGQSGTFKDATRRLPDIKRMGFDVIYLAPIHPIGRKNRKGPNNSLQAGPKDPGSPWAVGNSDGGHKAIHPELGTMADFERFVRVAKGYDIEIAMDFAIQCAPDHPYAKQHPEWFFRMPDGSIRYAENPPKKYEDIYPINFYGPHQAELILELKSIVDFWIFKGVKIFRVDNPHTKPFWFWRWMIDAVQAEHPEVIFLAEAFTRPKIMKLLAKAGFTQSYTYFTWRNAKWEIKEYLNELTKSDSKDYFRPNFFANTPDILPEVLQHGGRAAFKIRLTLAATLSPTYGIYSGYELCEGTPKVPGKEDYLDSEKYECKVWDWNRPGNIKDYVARLNRIRRTNPALSEFTNLEFYDSYNNGILAYGRATADLSNILIVVVNIDPFQVHEDMVRVPIWKFGIKDWETYRVKDLISGEKYLWKGEYNFVRLDPHKESAHILLLTK